MLVAACMLTYVAFFCHHAKQHVEGKVDKAVANWKFFSTFLYSFFSDFKRRF